MNQPETAEIKDPPVPWVFTFSCVLLRALFWMTGGLKCVGTENIPEHGGAIITPNHISLADPPAVGCNIPRHARFMSKEELFKPPIVGPWMWAVGNYPVRRGTADRQAIRNSIQMLDDGEVIAIFPEGTRSTDGKLREPELGVGLIAMKSRAPIIPAAIFGTDKVLPAHSKRLYRHPVTVYFGKPLTFPDLYDSKDTREAMEEIGRRIMAAIDELRTLHSK